MSKYDLMRSSDKELMDLYEQELLHIGATSLESIILEFDRRKTKNIMIQMNRLTIAVILLTFVNILISIIALYKG